MGLTTEHGGPGRPGRPVPGYESVPLLTGGAAVGGAKGNGAAVLRRRTARPSRRAVVYVHCLDDSFVPADLAGWYTDRGFDFYAADLRPVRLGAPGNGDAGRAAELAAYFACLDAAITHLRQADAIDTVVVSAHAAGALFAALWCHARRGSQPADALVLACPDLGAARPWPARAAAREDGAAGRASPLLAGAQRRLRRGLEIACPVLVMVPAVQAHGPGAAGGLGALGVLGALGALGTLAGRRATIRLGEHVTWLTLDGGLPGQAPAPAPQRRRFLDELGRWLSAYLSGQIRDQLLLSGRYWTVTGTIGYPEAPLGSGGAWTAVWV
jgi:Serine aminopeptidase, S33